MPTLGPPVGGGFLGQLQSHQRRCRAGAAAGSQGEFGEALQLGQPQIGITRSGQAQGAIAQTPELGLEAEIGAEPIQGIGRADQLLIGGGDPRPLAVEIGQKAPAAIGHGHAPDRRLNADRG